MKRKNLGKLGNFFRNFSKKLKKKSFIYLQKDVTVLKQVLIYYIVGNVFVIYVYFYINNKYMNKRDSTLEEHYGV